LLDDTRPRTNVRIRCSDTNAVCFEPELRRLTLASPDLAVEVLRQAQEEFASYYQETGWLPRYSTLVIQLKVSKDDCPMPGHLYLVDLMSSSRIVRACSDSERAPSTKALVALQDVLVNLDSKTFVPFRDSKLTFMLKQALLEEPEIILLLHISQNELDLDETLSTLRYGSRMKGNMFLQNKA
jgi:hypothetical protein